jgi:MFS family permease
VLVVGGSVFVSYIGHSMPLPHWFVRRRGLATEIAFSGVGIGSIVLLPWLQGLIGASGWRSACHAMAGLLLLILLPLNLLLQRGGRRTWASLPTAVPGRHRRTQAGPELSPSSIRIGRRSTGRSHARSARSGSGGCS